MEQNQHKKENQHSPDRSNHHPPNVKGNELNPDIPILNRKSSNATSYPSQGQDNELRHSGKNGVEKSQEHSNHHENTDIKMDNADYNEIETPQEEDLDNQEQNELPEEQEEEVSEATLANRDRRTGGNNDSLGG
ncbi:MAG: hypothetical protein ABI761_18800 [Saprospiraceae bacterium]